MKKGIFITIIAILLLGVIPVQAARTQSSWLFDSAGYIFPTQAPVNVLIQGTNRYLNFGTFSGVSGYGFRDNGGSMEFKNSGGSWIGIGSGGGGGSASTTLLSDDNSWTGQNGYSKVPTTSTSSSVLTSSLLADASSNFICSTWGDSLSNGSGGLLQVPYGIYLSQYTNRCTVVKNHGISSEIASQIANRMIKDPSTWDDFTIIWSGTNDVNAQATTTVLSDIQSMIAKLDAPKHYLVLGTIPYGLYTASTTNYWTCATSQGKDIVAVNNALSAAFGSNYFDMLGYLQAQAVGANDLSDVANCLVPRSLHAANDQIHLTDAAYKIIAQAVGAQVTIQLATSTNKVLTQFSTKGIVAASLSSAGISASSTADNVRIGFITPDSGRQTTAHDIYNFGNYSAQYIRAAYDSVCLLEYSCNSLRDGNNIIALGRGAALSAIDSVGIVSLGGGSCYRATGNGDICLGYQAGFNIQTANGDLIAGINIDPISQENGLMNIGGVLFGRNLFSDVNSFQGSTPVATPKIAIGTWDMPRTFNVVSTGNSDLGSEARAGSFNASSSAIILQQAGATFLRASTTLDSIYIGHNICTNNACDGIQNVLNGDGQAQLGRHFYSVNSQGYEALANLRDGHYLNAQGDRALFNCVDCYAITAIGTTAGFGQVNGHGDIYMGFQDGLFHVGDHSIIIGNNIEFPEIGRNKGLDIGNSLYCDGIYGDLDNYSTAAVTTVHCGVATSTPWKTWSVKGDMSLTGAYYDASSTPGTNGQVLTSTGTGTKWATVSGGGGSAGGTWATTTSLVAGQLINYPNNNTDIVAIGGNSTSSSYFYLDPNTSRASFYNKLEVGNFNNTFTAPTFAGLIVGANNTTGGSNTLTSGHANDNGGTNSATIGNANTISAVSNAMAIGNSNEVTHADAYAFGDTINLSGDDDFGMGANITLTQADLYGFGRDIMMTGGSSSASGENLSSTALYTYTLGWGVISGLPLLNDQEGAIYIGTNSNVPTLTITEASGVGTVGKVGVCTSTPRGAFDIHCGFVEGVGSAGSIVFDSNPVDGEQIFICDTGSSCINYEFDTDSNNDNGGDVLVTIGATSADTATTLEGLIPLDLAITVNNLGTTLDLTQNITGISGDQPITTTSSHITPHDFSGGVDEVLGTNIHTDNSTNALIINSDSDDGSASALQITGNTINHSLSFPQVNVVNPSDGLAGFSLSRSGGDEGGQWMFYRYGSQPTNADRFCIGQNGVSEPFCFTAGSTGGMLIGSAGISSTYVPPADGMLVAGSVGIGEYAPLSKLAVSGSLSIGAFSSIEAPTDGLIVSGAAAFGTSTAPTVQVMIQSNSGTGDALRIATTTNKTIAGFDNDGHQFTAGPAPAISSCGTGTGTVVGDDQSGVITTATAATACTMTFAKAYQQAPICLVTDNSLVGFADISSVSTSAVTFGISSALTGGKLYYQCIYHR